MTALDPRIHAYRPDLADIRLQGQVDAARYVTGTPGTIITTISNVRTGPSASHPVTTQALLGETLQIFETRDGFHWVQLDIDGFTGYIRTGDADTNKAAAPTHTITAKLAHVYSRADIKSEPLEILPMGARINAVGVETDTWLTLARGGHIKTVATRPLPTKDIVEIAARFTGAPYLWGGKTALGIDCSGLIQVAFHAAGLQCPRDSDMQEAALGEPLPPDAQPQRGDLIFFKGLVGIMWDETNLLHANATWMQTVIEPLADAEKRSAITSRHRI
jgi:cell wall-associated NlpC family hydrolase